MTSAYGWWGNVCCEFVEQHSDTPSAYRDTVKKGETRLHHIALAADDIRVQIAKYEAEGCPAALYAEEPLDVPYAIMDTSAQLGFMTELYEYWVVRPLYDLMKQSAAEFDGTDPIRPIQFTDFGSRPEFETIGTKAR